MKPFLACSFIIMFFNYSLHAQSLFTTVNVQKAYEKGTRTTIGKPGKNYWQNRADYRISVTFAPSTRLLQGSETIMYTNNSPDTLKKVIIRLYPDLYKKGVQRLSHIAEEDLNEGVQVESLRIGEENIQNFDNRRKAYHDQTNLIVTPDRPVLPHSSVKFEISWHYKVNAGSQVRTGMVDSNSYFIAYFFPRLAVYDDIDGWDTWSYNGAQEFYNDFGNFDLQVSLPQGYIVWATGDRVNAADNFSEATIAKINKAAAGDSILHIITPADYAAHTVFKPKPSGVWKFKAENVSDVAFALSNHYLWDASSVLTDSARGTRAVAEAVYNKIHEDYFDVASQAHQTVYYTSHFYPRYPFPFSHITVFDGTDQMEYPMMVNDNPTQTHKDAVQLTTHEIFHSYFPFFMGINETQYAWMDEGWASIGESVISPKMGEPEDEGIFSKTRYEYVSGTDRYVPLITNTKAYNGEAYLANSYGKGALCYYVLQDMLGDSLYFRSLHRYMDDWNGKHPVPYDFFYSFNTASGKNLNWFWQKWFFGWDYADLGIKKAERSGKNIRITVENKGGLPVPVYINVKGKDGRTTLIRYSAEVWSKGEKEKAFVIPQPYGAVAAIRIGNEYIPDKDSRDNKLQLR